MEDNNLVGQPVKKKCFKNLVGWCPCKHSSSLLLAPSPPSPCDNFLRILDTSTETKVGQKIAWKKLSSTQGSGPLFPFVVFGNFPDEKKSNQERNNPYLAEICWSFASSRFIRFFLQFRQSNYKVFGKNKTPKFGHLSSDPIRPPSLICA